MPHGLANAVVLPHAIRFNAFDAGIRYQELARMLGLVSDTVEQGTDSLIQAVVELNESMAIPCRISGLNIDESAFRADMEAMAGHVLEDICTEGNPRRPSAGDVKLLLEQAW